MKQLTKKDYDLICDALIYYIDYLSYKEDRTIEDTQKEKELEKVKIKIAQRLYNKGSKK